MSLGFTVFHSIPQDKRERLVGQKGKGKRAADSTSGAWMSLGIQTARPRTHDTKRFPGWTHPPTSDVYAHACIYIYIYTYVYIYRRLGGVSSPLGRPPRNREIVSCRACVRAVNVGWKCTSNVVLRVFPFPFLPGGLSFFPCEICESVSSCEF